MHSGPCRHCASAQVCHTEKPTLGIIAKEMFDALKLSIICPNDLYRIQYNVRFKKEEILETMYPISQANARNKSAVGQVSSMIKAKVKQGFLEQVKTVQKVLDDELL